MPATLEKNSRAFVIGPIGRNSSPERRLAEWVHSSIIQPACAMASTAEMPIEAFRSDHDRKPGKIIDDVIASIVNERIVFAVLAFDRPNVYYELALAKAAGREVIILKWSQEKTQFDTRDYRMIEFDFDPDGPAGNADPEKIREVADYVKSVLRQKPHRDKAFDRYDPLGRNFKEYKFYGRFRDLALDRKVNPDAELYGDVFLEAEQSLTLCGATLLHFTRYDLLYETTEGPTASFPDLVAFLTLAKGVDVRAVMLHPSNPNMAGLVASESARRQRAEVDRMRAECAQSFQGWLTIAEDIERANVYDRAPRKGRVEIVQLRNTIVGYRLTLTDKRLLMTPFYRQHAANSAGPTLSVHAETSFYDAIRDDLTTTIARDAAIGDETGS